MGLNVDDGRGGAVAEGQEWRGTTRRMRGGGGWRTAARDGWREGREGRGC